MKKVYIKPEMLVHQISKRSILLTSGGKGVYGKVKVDGVEQDAMIYGGYVDPNDEENYDPE